MSQDLDSILERLDRYEERLDATGRNLKRLVDQRIGVLKRKVKQIRERIRGGAPTRKPRHASEQLPSGTTDPCENILATRPTDQTDPAPLQDEPVPSTSTGHKRASNRRDKRRRSNRARSNDIREEDGDNLNSGVYKVKVINQDCPEGCQGLTLQTLKQYRDHLKKRHGLMPYKCLQQGCGQRFCNR